MKATRTALLAGLGLVASTLIAAAQTGDFSAGPLAAPSETAAPATTDATAAIHAMLADPAFSGAPGLAENAYDFNVPGGIPGFGPMGAGIPEPRFARAGRE